MDSMFDERMQNRLFLILSEPLKLRHNNIQIIKQITSSGFYTVVVTTNQPYSILHRDYEKEGVDIEKVYFVDAITKYALGRETEDAVNCTFINNPANLTDMGIAISEVLKKIEGKKVCILFDSVNSLLIYISSTNLTKFIHFISSKLKILDMSGVFLAVEKGIDPDILTQLASFVDEIIEGDQDFGDTAG